MIVFVLLWEQGYEGKDVLGVFDNHAAAEAAIMGRWKSARRLKSDGQLHLRSRDDDVTIEEHEVAT